MQRKKDVKFSLPWDDVRLFLALCRAPTARDAAAALSVDASTVSRRLSALEEELGAVLFDRGRDGLAATAAAEGLLPVAEQIEEAVLRFAHAADGLEREPSGTVRITCPPDVAEVALAPLLGELLAKHPELTIEIEPGEAVLDLTRREADIALRTVRPTRGDLVATRVLRARWVLVASRKLARRLGVLRSWEGAPWVTCGERFSGLPSARWLQKHAPGALVLVRSDSLAVQLAVVAAGTAMALVPEPSVRHYGLRPVKLSPALEPASAEWPVDDLYLVTHRALRSVPRVRAVWEFLVQRLPAFAPH